MIVMRMGSASTVARTWALGFALALLPAPAAAQPATDGAIDDAIDSEIGNEEFDIPDLPDSSTPGAWPRVSFESETSWMVDGDFDGADVSWATTGGEVGIPIPVSRHLGFEVELGADATFYDFDGNKGFLNSGQGSGDPFDELIDTWARAWGRYRLNDSWSLLGVGSLRSRFEDGAPFGSGFEGGGGLGGSYTYGDDRFEVLAAVGTKSRMHKSGVGIVTILRVKWKISDRFRLRADLNGGRISAQLCDTVTASLFGYLDGSRYRLADRNDGVGGVGRGSLRERYAPVGVGLRWKPEKRWRVNLSLGSIVYQQLKVYDNDDDSFDSASLDGPAFYGALRVTYRFGR
jgi:hypothetical protein